MWLFWNLFNGPVDNFAIAVKDIFKHLGLPLDKEYRTTEEDDTNMRQAIVLGEVNINPMIQKGLLFYLSNSISWFTWHNARDLTYQIHMDVAQYQFNVDVRDSSNKISKDKATLEKYFWY